jgi:hypothetical protein
MACVGTEIPPLAPPGAACVQQLDGWLERFINLSMKISLSENKKGGQRQVVRYRRVKAGAPVRYRRVKAGAPVRYRRVKAGAPVRYRRVKGEAPVRYRRVKGEAPVRYRRVIPCKRVWKLVTLMRKWHPQFYEHSTKAYARDELTRQMEIEGFRLIRFDEKEDGLIYVLGWHLNRDAVFSRATDFAPPD